MMAAKRLCNMLVQQLLSDGYKSLHMASFLASLIGSILAACSVLVKCTAWVWTFRQGMNL